MQKSDSLSLSSDVSLNYKSTSSTKNYSHSDSLDMSCPKCNTKIFSSFIINKQNESSNYNIKILCNKNHMIEMPLSRFNQIYHPTYTKECSNCKKQIELKKMYYCSTCKLFLCNYCLCGHKKESCNICNYFGLLENVCKIHTQKIQEFYCFECKIYLCKLCLQNHPQNHTNIINLKEKFNKYEKIIGDEIVKEKILVEKYNSIINALRENISNKIKQKKMRLELKKSILNSYINNHMNYYYIQNMDFAMNQLKFDFDEKKLKNLVEQLKKY